jgi:hypothetical protein
LVAWFHRCHRLPFQDSTTLAPFLAEAKNMQVVLLPQLSPRIGTPGPVIACQDLPFQISALVGPPLAMQKDRVAQDSAAGALPGGFGSRRHIPPFHCSANARCLPELPMNVPVAMHQKALVQETSASASFLAARAAEVAELAAPDDDAAGAAAADVARPAATTAASTDAPRTRQARKLAGRRPGNRHHPVLLLSGPGRTSPSTRAVAVTGGTRAGREWLTSHL